MRLSKCPRYTPGSFSFKNGRLKFPDSASFFSMYTELFKKEIYKFETVEKDLYIIDCGSNIGLSILYFHSLFPHAKIIGFEPDQDIFAFLKYNISQFPELKNIELINKGVWSKIETLYFNNEGADAGRIAYNDGAVRKAHTMITTVPLSPYINRKVNFLKIDIEGAEVEVLNEIEHKLDLVEKIFIEFHSFEDQPQHLDVILAILKKNGFRYYIDSPSRYRNRPFIEKTMFLSFDLLLNIYAYKN